MAFGSVRSGREPVVLLLRAGHYQLVQRKAGKQWPKPWSSAEPAKLDSVAFRGGGKSCASSSKHSWRPQGTPESSKPNWRPQATPSTNPRRQVMQSKTSTKNSWRPQSTPSTKVQSQWKKRSAKNSNNSVACPTKSPATTHNKKPSVGNGVKETFVWTCNLCEQCFRYSNKRSLACARRRLIQKTHPGKFNKVHACFRRPRVEPAEASSQIPPNQRAWSCPKCNQGLGYMPRHKLKVSRDQHVMKCFKISLSKLRKMHYKSPIWKDLHKRLVEKNAADKESLTNAEIASFNQQHQAAIFRIPRRFTTSNRQDEFGCAHCTRLNQHFIPITRHKCPGADGRATFLTNGRRRAFWRQKRLEPNQDTVKFLVKQWQLTKAEVQLMESGAFNNSKIPPLRACSWYRDLTADGDIESNPGPSKAQSMECCAVNVNGRENAWAVARAVVQQRPAVAILQQHCMLSDKQADLTNFLNKRGYRSWWVAPPMARNILGQAYTSGGVAIFVHKDKTAREIHRHVTADGQAILLQLDHVYLIGAYLPPRRLQPNNTLTILDEWVCSFGSQDPVFMLADFNAEPELAQRWTHLAGGGAVKTVLGPDGKPLPTRWNGKRCIDWAWCSHPGMLTNLKFSDMVIADHKVLEFQLKYDQQQVRSYKQMHTHCNFIPQRKSESNSGMTRLKKVGKMCKCQHLQQPKVSGGPFAPMSKILTLKLLNFARFTTRMLVLSHVLKAVTCQSNSLILKPSD